MKRTLATVILLIFLSSPLCAIGDRSGTDDIATLLDNWYKSYSNQQEGLRLINERSDIAYLLEHQLVYSDSEEKEMFLQISEIEQSIEILKSEKVSLAKKYGFLTLDDMDELINDLKRLESQAGKVLTYDSESNSALIESLQSDILDDKESILASVQDQDGFVESILRINDINIEIHISETRLYELRAMSMGISLGKTKEKYVNGLLQDIDKKLSEISNGVVTKYDIENGLVPKKYDALRQFFDLQVQICDQKIRNFMTESMTKE